MTDEPTPLVRAQHERTAAERLAQGRALRGRVPRSSHAIWATPTDRPDPIALLVASNRSHIPSLVPIRYGRMLTSPFAFLRGAAIVMAADLATTPVTGLQVQMGGDAHLSNFGIYATPERKQVFDVNDFDETVSGPWEWDVKRLAASIVVAGRQNGFPAPGLKGAVLHCVRTYRERMKEFARMSHLDVWYSSIDADQLLAQVGRVNRPFLTRELARAYQHTNAKAFPQLTRKRQGHYLIQDHPPLIVHLEDEERADFVRALLEGYEASLSEERRVLLNRYRVVDLAQKVVGVGSVGTHCTLALLLGSPDGDPLFLQIKEAQPSVYEQHLPHRAFANQAQRVVAGQRLMQAASDIFLGWTTSGSRDYYVRQLRDRKETPTIEQLTEQDFTLYAGFCGWTLARAHARSGDPATISGYLGKSDPFDRALAAFAQTYADQTERDHEALVEAAQSGRINAERLA